jgi:hypothetical protein
MRQKATNSAFARVKAAGQTDGRTVKDVISLFTVTAGQLVCGRPYADRFDTPHTAVQQAAGWSELQLAVQGGRKVTANSTFTFCE